MVRSEHSPPRIIPHRGQIPENSVESSASKEGGVFHKDVPRSHLANDSRHVRPHSASLSVDSSALAGCADVLAGKPARNHVNNSAPGLSVECSRVIPNGERLKASVILSRHEDVSWVLGIFNGADGSPSEQFAAENSPTSARE
jgi:hypothetical protein